jgi:hypothetical protein
MNLAYKEQEEEEEEEERTYAAWYSTMLACLHSFSAPISLTFRLT